MSPERRLALAACAVATCDLAQPLLLPWQPRMVAALAGAGIYLAIAAGALRGARVAAIVGLAMPVIPVTALLAAAARGVDPGAATGAVLLVQLVVAGCAWDLLERPR